MSKATKCNLTRAQYEFLSEMIPEQKPGGRKSKKNPHPDIFWNGGC